MEALSEDIGDCPSSNMNPPWVIVSPDTINAQFAAVASAGNILIALTFTNGPRSASGQNSQQLL
jgi:hypothetical protein